MSSGTHAPFGEAQGRHLVDLFHPGKNASQQFFSAPLQSPCSGRHRNGRDRTEEVNQMTKITKLLIGLAPIAVFAAAFASAWCHWACGALARA